MEENPFLDPDAILQRLGYPLETLAPEGALVDAVRLDGALAYASGQVPFNGNELTSKGKVPSQISIEEATKAAALCAANALRAIRCKVGSLNRIHQIVRLTGYVNADQDFTEAHIVINGASELIRHVFGDAGRHARTAIGVSQLPLGASTEIEMIASLK